MFYAYLGKDGSFIEELPGQDAQPFLDRTFKVSTLTARNIPTRYNGVIALTGHEVAQLIVNWAEAAMPQS